MSETTGMSMRGISGRIESDGDETARVDAVFALDPQEQGRLELIISTLVDVCRGLNNT